MLWLLEEFEAICCFCLLSPVLTWLVVALLLLLGECFPAKRLCSPPSSTRTSFRITGSYVLFFSCFLCCFSTVCFVSLARVLQLVANSVDRLCGGGQRLASLSRKVLQQLLACQSRRQRFRSGRHFLHLLRHHRPRLALSRGRRAAARPREKVENEKRLCAIIFKHQLQSSFHLNTVASSAFAIKCAPMTIAGEARSQGTVPARKGRI